MQLAEALACDKRGGVSPRFPFSETRLDDPIGYYKQLGKFSILS